MIQIKNVAINSSAFPPTHSPITTSSSHLLFNKPYFQHQQPKIRQFIQSDLDQIQKLHKQWFPLNYGKAFFSRIYYKRVKCLVAQCEISYNQKQNQQEVQGIQKKYKIIVGVIVYEISEQTDWLAKKSWKQYLVSQYKSVYIMTLGVIEQFRKKGVATMLLNEIKQRSKKQENVKYISLHVVGYNSASNFYEKNGFREVQYLKNYYSIFNKEYDAKKLILFVNGGQPRIGWIPWIKKIVGYQ